MMVTNQVAIAQVWPFLDSDEVVVDWLPWNHTFGGNLITNMVLRRRSNQFLDEIYLPRVMSTLAPLAIRRRTHDNCKPINWKTIQVT